MNKKGDVIPSSISLLLSLECEFLKIYAEDPDNWNLLQMADLVGGE
jgi:hypothetical protein